MNSKRNLRAKRSCNDTAKSLPSRTLDTTLGSQLSLMDKAEPQWTVDKLTTNYIPDEIVGRNEQKQVISNFVQDCILNRINSKVLYISGVPGVGKTASTMEILRKLQEEYSRKAKFGFINALTLKRPDHIYKMILAIITGEKENLFKGICQKIQSVLAGLKKSHVIVIDEVDFLLTKDQQIFYNLFEWVAHVTSKLGLIIIANTMDFPERLSGKINSRMGNHRLVFKPYSYSQIKQIIDERLHGCKYFAPNALTFISKKLSTYSSDIRTILEILHKAVRQHIQLQKKGKISIDTVHELWQQKMRTIQTQTSNMSPLHGQVIQLLKKNDRQSNSLALLEVLSQRGVTQASLMIILKQLEQQGYVVLRESYRAMFKCFNVKLVCKLSEE